MWRSVGKRGAIFLLRLLYCNCDMCLCREHLNQTLELVQNLIVGAAAYLPMWEGVQVEGW